MADQAEHHTTRPEQVTVHFSFGHGQRDPDTGKDLLDHYVTILGPSYAVCREAMFASRFGNRWAFDYIDGDPSAEEWIPRWTEHDRIVVACTPECDDLCVPGAKTGEARGWHHDDCPWGWILNARNEARLDEPEDSRHCAHRGDGEDCECNGNDQPMAGGAR